MDKQESIKENVTHFEVRTILSIAGRRPDLVFINKKGKGACHLENLPFLGKCKVKINEK